MVKIPNIFVIFGTRLGGYSHSGKGVDVGAGVGADGIF
jgi:hypothetical protein